MASVNDLFLHRRCPRDVDDDSRHEPAQVEATVETVGESGQIALAVLAELQRVVSAGQHGLEVAEHRVDPLELGQVARLEATNDSRHVDAPRLGDGGEAPQAIARDDRPAQAGLGPVSDRLRREAPDQIELGVDRLTRIVQGHRRHEWDLVLRATPGLAARALATQVGVVDLNSAFEAMAGFLPSHGVVDLVVQQPGGRVAHAQIALVGQGRQSGLGLADEVDGQEPGRQRQLGVLHHRTGDQGGLMPASDALEQLAGAVTDDVVRRTAAAGAAKAIGPSRASQRLGAMRLGAEHAQEFRDRHARLELDAVAGHRELSLCWRPQVRGSVAHGVSLAEAGF